MPNDTKPTRAPSINAVLTATTSLPDLTPASPEVACLDTARNDKAEARAEAMSQHPSNQVVTPELEVVYAMVKMLEAEMAAYKAKSPHVWVRVPSGTGFQTVPAILISPMNTWETDEGHELFIYPREGQPYQTYLFKSGVEADSTWFRK
jgi:hypothetical protein